MSPIYQNLEEVLLVESAGNTVVDNAGCISSFANGIVLLLLQYKKSFAKFVIVCRQFQINFQSAEELCDMSIKLL